MIFFISNQYQTLDALSTFFYFLLNLATCHIVMFLQLLPDPKKKVIPLLQEYRLLCMELQ